MYFLNILGVWGVQELFMHVSRKFEVWLKRNRCSELPHVGSLSVRVVFTICLELPHCSELPPVYSKNAYIVYRMENITSKLKCTNHVSSYLLTVCD